MSLVDKMMLVKMLEYSREITAAYDRFDLREVYQRTLEFVVRDISEFYLDFSKFRRRR